MASGFISPGRHGIIDYGFSIVSLAGPAIIGLSGSARVLPATLGLGVGALAALTDHPYAVKRQIALSTHGKIETMAVPAFFLAVASSDALHQPKARLFFAGYFATALVTFFLTDYNRKSIRDDRPRSDRWRGASR